VTSPPHRRRACRRRSKARRGAETTRTTSMPLSERPCTKPRSRAGELKSHTRPTAQNSCRRIGDAGMRMRGPPPHPRRCARSIGPRRGSYDLCRGHVRAQDGGSKRMALGAPARSLAWKNRRSGESGGVSRAPASWPARPPSSAMLVQDAGAFAGEIGPQPEHKRWSPRGRPACHRIETAASEGKREPRAAADHAREPIGEADLRCRTPRPFRPKMLETTAVD